MNAPPIPKDLLAAVMEGKSRTSVAHTTHARAVERIEDLGRELRSAFAGLDKAMEELERVGVLVSHKFDWPLDETWKMWQAKRILSKHDKGGKR